MQNLKLIFLQFLVFSVTLAVAHPFLWGLFGTREAEVGPEVEYGECSWYGPEEGLPPIRMANGELLNPVKLTAAHRTLPLGTFAIITNPDNGKFVQVQITDRGPNVFGRISALSPAAFASIADLDQKVVSCTLTAK